MTAITQLLLFGDTTESDSKVLLEILKRRGVTWAARWLSAYCVTCEAVSTPEHAPDWQAAHEMFADGALHTFLAERKP